MRYSFTRKVNLGKYGLQFESADFTVEDAESPAQAQKVVEDWMQDYVEELEARTQVKKVEQAPFDHQPVFDAVRDSDTYRANLDPIAPRKQCKTCKQDFNPKYKFSTECSDCYKPKK